MLSRNGEPAGDVPARLVEDEHGVGVGRHGVADLGEVRLHRFGVGEGHDEGRALAEPRTDRAENVGPLRSLVVRRPGSRAAARPAAGDQVLLSDPRLVLEPDLDAPAVGVAVADLRDSGREAFLNASIASGS